MLRCTRVQDKLNPYKGTLEQLLNIYSVYNSSLQFLSLVDRVKQ